MNGRVYDPEIGRFMSVDPVFQFPENTQSLNPYSYVLNNPLSLTDPSGFAACADTESGGGSGTCTFESGGKTYTAKYDTKKDGSTAVRTNQTGRGLVIGAPGKSPAGNGANQGSNGANTAQETKVAGSSQSNPNATNRLQTQGQAPPTVTGSGSGATYDLNAVPKNDVVATDAQIHDGLMLVDKAASDGLKKTESGRMKLTDGTIIPCKGSNDGCVFPTLQPGQVPAAFGHTHVPSDWTQFPDKQSELTKLRVGPGPGDHALLVKYGVPNVYRGTNGVDYVLEYTKQDGYYYFPVRGDASKFEGPKQWKPQDAIPKN